MKSVTKNFTNMLLSITQILKKCKEYKVSKNLIRTQKITKFPEYAYFLEFHWCVIFLLSLNYRNDFLNLQYLEHMPSNT